MATNSDLRTIGLGFCWQDYEVADRFQTIGRTVTEADLVNFINTTGMTEVMFNNLVYIDEKSAVRGGAGAGGLAYSIAEGLSCSPRCSIRASLFSYGDGREGANLCR